MEDLLLDKELPILRKTVQSFVKEHVGTAEFSQGIYAKDLPKEVAAFLKEKAKTIGFKSLGARKEWGGAGLSLYARTVIYEEAAQHRLGLYHPAADAFGEELPSFLETCTREQINTFVKPAIQEGKGCFIAVWEDLEGDRIKNITCTAVKNGDEWVINGEKSYIQKMDQAGFGVILVNCITEEGNKKPGLFLLNPDDPFEKNETVLIDVQKTHSISLNQFVIHDNRRIGEVGEGLILVKQWLAESQILLGARCLGVSAKAVEYAKSYAKLRITRGKPLSEFPTIRSMIANAVISLKAARLMVQDAAKKVDNKDSDWEIAAQIAKLYATETASKIIDDCLQIHGGSGFAGDLPIERWYKEIRIARVNLQKSETILENLASLLL